MPGAHQSYPDHYSNSLDGPEVGTLEAMCTPKRQRLALFVSCGALGYYTLLTLVGSVHAAFAPAFADLR